jgi:hypothetical protein
MHRMHRSRQASLPQTLLEHVAQSTVFMPVFLTSPHLSERVLARDSALTLGLSLWSSRLLWRW